jgi:predicted permease
MGTIFADLKFGCRLLSRRPGFTAIAVFTLALGIGVTTAMFSVLDTMYWKAFPGAADPGRLVELETVASDGSMVQGSWLHFREYRDRLRPVAAVAAHLDKVFNLGQAERAKPVWGELVSANYFAVLGVAPSLGRAFSREESSDAPGASPVAVISHRLWAGEFSSSRNVLGKTIRVNRHDLKIIGVAPPAFRGAMGGGIQCDVWVPFTMGAELGLVESATFTDSALRNLYMFARLAPGHEIAEARGEAAALAARLALLGSEANRGFGATFEPMWRAHLHGRAAFLYPMLILMAVSLLVLVIVCANVANLLLARSVGRMGEFGIRCALGAGGWRMARQCFTETLLLAGAGAVVGLPLSLWMTDSASLLLPPLARAGSIPLEMDGRVVGFAVLMCVAAAFASSSAAVLFVMRSELTATLREGGRTGTPGSRSHRLRGLLVVSEVALALLVLIGAGLFLRSYRNVNLIDPGFNRAGVLLADFPMANGGYSVEELQRFCFRLRQALEPAPGVAAVTYADYAPLFATDGPYSAAQPEGFMPRRSEDLKLHRTSVAPGYFALIGTPLLEGRDFTERDDSTSEPVMIVNQAFAGKFYGGASPVGRRVKVRGKWHRVVGLVRDSKYFSFTEPARPHCYLPFRQWYLAGQRVYFFVRAKGDPESVIPSMRRVAAAIDPNASSFTAAPLAEYNALLLFPLKVAANILAALAVIAFLLAGVGLYGVISYAVTQRRRELGIRMALGARPRAVLGAVARDGLLLTAGGVACGLALALVSMRLLGGLLVGVSPFDPLTFAVASLFLIGVAAIACFLPALRAARTEPLAALRSE